MQKTIRIAAVADIHVKDSDSGKWQEFFRKAEEEADILLLCGDLTDHGRPSEAKVLKKEISNCKIPILAVLGNHDYDHGEPEGVKEILADCVKILDGDSVVVKGVGFAGIKGFGGGFGRSVLSMFGEPVLKQFVQEALDETIKLETALARLEHQSRDMYKIVLMHYAPIKETVEGEPEAISPWLGCSRFEEPINKMRVDVVFHGHAHLGKMSGKSSQGVDVYNVSIDSLERHGSPLPFFIYEVPVHADPQESHRP